MAYLASFSSRGLVWACVPLLVGSAWVAGCTQQQAGPAFSTPWVGVIYPCGAAAGGQGRPDTLLADSDFFFPRGGKYVEGPMPISTVSASSTFTYDAQPIGLPGGNGYRYTYSYRENITLP